MSELWDYSDEDGAEDGVDPAESEGAPAETAPQSRKHSGRSGLNFEAGVNISEASGDTSKKRGRKCAYRSDEEKKAARNASARKWRAKKKAGKEATSGSRANSACDSSGVDSDAAAALGSAAAPGMHAEVATGVPQSGTCACRNPLCEEGYWESRLCPRGLLLVSHHLMTYLLLHHLQGNSRQCRG